MRVFVRCSSTGKTLQIDVTPGHTIKAIKELVEEVNSCLAADSHSLLYQGRILRNLETAASCGLAENHTLLIVPAVPSTATAAPEDTQAHQQRTPVLQQWLQGSALYGLPFRDHELLLRDDDEDALYDVPGSAQEASETPEGDYTDLVLGIAMGFMLGCLAGLCMIESGLSRRMRLGAVLGIGCNFMFAFLRLSLMPFQAADT